MSEGSELHFNMQNLEPQRNTEENRKFLPLMNADDADQEKQNPEPQRAQRNTEGLFSTEALNRFGLKFFCHFA